jgi:mono/diheme cytochrome c family protein
VNWTSIAFAALLISFMPATGSQAADAGNGLRLAQRWCAPCHVVEPNQRQPTGEAPPFAAVAKRPDFDAARVAFFLLDPHPKMPNMGLSRSEAQDLAAYIATQRR